MFTSPKISTVRDLNSAFCTGPEVIGMSDRTLVMRDGRIRGELLGDDINEQAIMALATHR